MECHATLFVGKSIFEQDKKRGVLAPVVLFVYNRPEHTLQTLRALKANRLADKTDLFIFADGPKADATLRELKAIKKVRQIIKETSWCSKLVITERESNLGLADSVIAGVTEIINKYGKVIVLEDDIVCSTYFLQYMNFHLDEFGNNSEVFGISGFSFTKQSVSNKSYLLPILSSWGWASWKDRWSKFEYDAIKLKPLINKDLFDFGGYPYFKMLNDQINEKVNSWAIRFYSTMFLEKKYYIYPSNSLVMNIGFDNTGEHCGNESPFKIESFLETPIIYEKNITVDNNIIKKVENEFKSIIGFQKKSLLEKIVNYLKNVFTN